MAATGLAVAAGAFAAAAGVFAVASSGLAAAAGGNGFAAAESGGFATVVAGGFAAADSCGFAVAVVGGFAVAVDGFTGTAVSFAAAATNGLVVADSGFASADGLATAPGADSFLWGAPSAAAKGANAPTASETPEATRAASAAKMLADRAAGRTLAGCCGGGAAQVFASFFRDSLFAAAAATAVTAGWLRPVAATPLGGAVAAGVGLLPFFGSPVPKTSVTPGLLLPPPPPPPLAPLAGGTSERAVADASTAPAVKVGVAFLAPLAESRRRFLSCVS